MVFFTFFNLSLNLAIRSSLSEPQSTPGLVFANCIDLQIAGRNINNLRYADDTTLMAEREELKSLLMKVKEEN